MVGTSNCGIRKRLSSYMRFKLNLYAMQIITIERGARAIEWSRQQSYKEFLKGLCRLWRPDA